MKGCFTGVARLRWHGVMFRYTGFLFCGAGSVVFWEVL